MFQKQLQEDRGGSDARQLDGVERSVGYVPLRATIGIKSVNHKPCFYLLVRTYTNYGPCVGGKTV